MTLLTLGLLLLGLLILVGLCWLVALGRALARLQQALQLAQARDALRRHTLELEGARQRRGTVALVIDALDHGNPEGSARAAARTRKGTAWLN